MTLREQLLELTEPKYMKFTSALMPGVENVLGIRLPVLRSIAKEIAAGDWRAAGAVLAGIVALVLAGAAVYARARTRHRSRSQSS